MAYATLTQVKDYLGITASVSDDNLLNDLILRAEGLIDAYTGAVSPLPLPRSISAMMTQTGNS